jgi:uncharacterized membrane protein
MCACMCARVCKCVCSCMCMFLCVGAGGLVLMACSICLLMACIFLYAFLRVLMACVFFG